MRLLMLSGDRAVAAGRKGPFWAMQAEFSRHFERIDVLCPRPDGAVVRTEIHGNVLLHPASCGRSGMVAYIKRMGSELLAEHRHGLIVSHDYGRFYNGHGAAWLSARHGVPYVSEIHHVPGYPVAADVRERIERLLTRRFVRWAAGRVRAFRVVNHGQLPPLLESWGVPPQKIAVLPSLYIDLETFSPCEGSHDGAPEGGVAPERDLVFVGRMVANKGLERLVDALALSARRGIRLRTLLLGTGPRRSAIEARVARHGLSADVEFVDWVEEAADLARLYRTSRACVCASTCEGGPRFTVEAMACGVPVVSTPVGVMGELLEDGRAGRLTGFDVEGLAAALDDVLGDEGGRRAMGRHARGLAEGFAYAPTIERYAEGLKRLAAGQGVEARWKHP